MILEDYQRCVDDAHTASQLDDRELRQIAFEVILRAMIDAWQRREEDQRREEADP
jgi:hypothetical protein